jgi:hypothetical protein
VPTGSSRYSSAILIDWLVLLWMYRRRIFGKVGSDGRRIDDGDRRPDPGQAGEVGDVEGEQVGHAVDVANGHQPVQFGHGSLR